MCATFASHSESISATLAHGRPFQVPRHFSTFCGAAHLRPFAFPSSLPAFSNRRAERARIGGCFIFVSIQPITGETEPSLRVSLACTAGPFACVGYQPRRLQSLGIKRRRCTTFAASH